MRLCLVSIASCMLFASVAQHANAKTPRAYYGKAMEGATQVELFAAMESGDVEVKVIPKDATRANIMIENKSGKPLSIKLPKAFAAVPVLAQRGGLGGGGLGGGGLGGGGLGGGGLGGGGGQGLGGGLGGGGLGGGGLGGGGGGFGGGGGAFNVGPDAIGKVAATTVCLEHGKKDPNPRMAYELKKIDTFTTNPRVQEICRLVGDGKLSQEIAQAMTWHYTDDLSWQELANKIKVKHLNGTVEYFFTRQQVMVASRMSAQLEQKVPAESEHVPSPGEQAAVN